MMKDRFKSALIGTLFFAVFQPFGLSEFGRMKWTLLAGILGIGLFSCLASELLVVHVVRMPFDLSKSPAYTFKRGLLFQSFNVVILSAGIAEFLDRFACSATIDNHWSWTNFLGVFAACLCATTTIGLYWRNVYLRMYYFQQLEEAQLLNGVLMERTRQAAMNPSGIPPATGTLPEQPTERLLLEGTTKEHLALALHDFLYAEAEGNYVSVCHRQEGGVKKTLLRTSIKRVASAVCPYAEIMQCHRAFLVNLCQVDRVEGRSSGISLQMKYCNDRIPVSKTYVNEVKERIKHPAKESR